MDFDSVEDAWEFWTEFGARTGFTPRRFYSHTSRKDGLLSNAVFVCNKEGKRSEESELMMKKRERAETRTSSQVKLGIHREPTTFGKYRVYRLHLEHNHVLHTRATVHMMPSQRHITRIQANEIELADASGIQIKRSHELMSKRSGGVEGTGFIELDHKNFLRTRRQRELRYGDAGSILSYFAQKTKENPFFYYDLQLDNEEQITNIFWADAKMRIDYGLFGDVASFDTTYSTNKESRPFGVFVGLNHHRSTVIFGAAILYDETAASFEWLFQSFLNCHSQKRPKTIFTDQDPAMAKAICSVMQGTYHGLCTFHIMLNGIRHLGNLMKGGSSFLTHFQECMYNYSSEEAFENAWLSMVSKYYVQGNKWLLSIYKIKEKWASCYMKNVHSLGMRSTQLSESCNAELKRHLKSIIQCDKRVGQYDLKSFFDGDEATVSFDHVNEVLLCSCKKFEDWGFLCRHAIRVLDLNFIFKIPKKYILLRWTRDVVTHQVKDTNGCDVHEDVHLDVTKRYQHLCPKLVRLADYAAQSTKGYEFVLSQISEWMKTVEIKSEEHIPNLPTYDAAPPMCYQGKEVKGLAKKVRMNKGGKRLKPWFEKKSNKKVYENKGKQPNNLAKIGYVKHGVSFLAF
uniref:SWIM-type domain-containing protein n=1 Tax=Kalanchoe fedtschenkoi TaxID=63787 RepID=A0A7N0UF56_KALFE